MHEVLGLRDVSRTDLIVTPDGEPTFLEVNVSPGMTETSSVPLAIEAADWSLGQMCADLVRTAAARATPGARPARSDHDRVGSRPRWWSCSAWCWPRGW